MINCYSCRHYFPAPYTVFGSVEHRDTCVVDGGQGVPLPWDECCDKAEAEAVESEADILDNWAVGGPRKIRIEEAANTLLVMMPNPNVFDLTQAVELLLRYVRMQKFTIQELNTLANGERFEEV